MILTPPRVALRAYSIGRHRIEFTDGQATDPGLNDGERAYLQGLGFRFVDDEPAPEPKAPAKAPAKAKAKATPKPKPAPAEGDEADTDTDGK